MNKIALRTRQRTLAAFSGCMVAAFLGTTAGASAQTTVAITTTVARDAAPADRELAAQLLALLELEASGRNGLQVVERRQLDLALYEQVISNASNESRVLQLGKLTATDLILTVRLLKSDSREYRKLLVRVTESETAVIRGLTVVPISAAEIEETATETIGFLASQAETKRQKTPTIAVLPLESRDRFDRLRPLERGLRDLFVSTLMRQDGCRVVQRSSMEQLLAELELARGGLTNAGRGLDESHARQSTYVLRGHIDERIAGEEHTIILQAELFDVATNQVVTRLERTCRPQDIASATSEIAMRLSGAAKGREDATNPAKDHQSDEFERLYELAMRDVYRVIRHSPRDAGYTPLEVPGTQRPPGIRARVDAGSPLGEHLLVKSIDRLESLLFIEPDRPEVALPLAYCLSFHVDGAWRPEQCEKLLRRIRHESADEEYYREASRLLADMYFPHSGMLQSAREIARLDPHLVERAFRRRLEVFQTMRTDCLSSRWLSLLQMLEKICECRNDDALWKKLLDAVVDASNRAATIGVPETTQDSLASNAAGMARRLVRRKDTTAALKKEASQLLEVWSSEGNPWQRLHSKRDLRRLSDLSVQEYLHAIDEARGDAQRGPLYDRWVGRRIALSRQLAGRGDAATAARVLESFTPTDQTEEKGHNSIASHYGFQLGQCYELLGRRQEALATYLKYAELPHGYSSGCDFEGRIKALGGVPIDKDRDVFVRYPERSPGEPLYCRVLASDGDHLFCAGGFEKGRVGSKATPIHSIQALEFASGVWRNLGGPDDRVSCMAAANGYLWAGTDSNGLWRREIASGDWIRWTVEQGLPTSSIAAVEAHGSIAFAAVGNLKANRSVVSGGVVRVNPCAAGDEQAVHIYQETAAPNTAPSSMTINANQLIARGVGSQLHRLDLRTNQWSVLPHAHSWIVDSGPSGVWTAKRDHLAAFLEASEADRKKYPAAGQLEDYPSGTFLPSFFVEHSAQLWIGGTPWRKVGDSGLFRLDLNSGKLRRYGPRDGFRYANHNRYECYDGVWANGSLWVATSFGLAEVVMREQ